MQPTRIEPLRRIGICVALLACGVVHAGELRVFTDADGVLVFTDLLPDSSAATAPVSRTQAPGVPLAHAEFPAPAPARQDDESEAIEYMETYERALRDED
ncbi:MAG: hypothetical protein ACOY7P_10945 [Pseudomonadota bacterium]